MMTLSDVQKFLDCYVLSYMNDNRPIGWRPEEYAFSLASISDGGIFSKDLARVVCRSLTDRGFACYVRGLFDEDGKVAGSGYAITAAGTAYLNSLTTRPATQEGA